MIRSKRKRARVARREQRDRDRQARGFMWRVDVALADRYEGIAKVVPFVTRTRTHEETTR